MSGSSKYIIGVDVGGTFTDAILVNESTGETRTVRDFAARAFDRLNLPLRWEGEGEAEVGISEADGRTLVRVDPRYFRPTEVEILLGDPTQAKEVLGWEPQVTLEDGLARTLDWFRSRVTKQGEAAPRED